MKRSEEEIKESWSVVNKGLVRAHFPDEMKVLKDAITELLTLRRRMDREEISNLIVKNCDEYGSGDNAPHNAADAIIKYLEGKDG